MKRIFALIISLTLIAACAFSQDTKEVKKTVDLSKDGEVYIDTYKGSITVETWDKPQVDIVARIEPDGWDSRAKEAVEETEVDIDGSPGEVRITSDYDHLKRHHSSFWGLFEDGNYTMPFVHYTISMPRTAHLSIKDYKSESRIANLHAPIDLNTYKGKVTISGLEGSLNLETYKGDARVAMIKLTDKSRVDTYKGTIQIDLSRDAGFELETDLGRKADFDSDFDVIYHSKHHSSDEVHGKINGGGPTLRLSTEKGSIRLRAR